MLEDLTLSEKVAVVIAVVEAIKGLTGLNGKWAILYAVIAGIVLELASVAVVQFPSVAPWVDAVFTGAILIGLSAAGIYRLTKRAGEGIVSKIANAVTISRSNLLVGGGTPYNYNPYMEHKSSNE